MFAARITIGTIIVLLAWTCRGICQTPAPDLPAPPPGREPRLADMEYNASSNWAEKLFPDGLFHDFGVLQSGTQAYHAFRIVNTSKYPLQFASVRISSTVALSGRSTKLVLQPNEEGKVEVILHPARFVGPKTHTLYVTFDRPRIAEVGLRIKAVSRDD